MRILANLNIAGTLDIDNVQNAGVDTDRFLVQDANGVVRYRTGAELASDIGSVNIAASRVEHLVKLGESASKGQAVYVSSSDGTNMIVSKASNTTDAMSSKTMGLLRTGGVTNDQVYLVTEGLLDGLNTSGATAGDPVWLGVNGNLIFGTANKPYAPAHLVFLGIVTRVQSVNGEIFVKVQNGFELEELHNVQITSTPANNTALSYESSTGLYKMKSIQTLLGYTPVSTATTITINGTTFDLSANRSWSVGTVTGTGTTSYLAKFTGSGSIGNSIVFDNGTGVGINNASPSSTLDVVGTFQTAFTSTSLTDGQAGSRIYATYTPSTNISNRNLYNINQIGAFNFTNGALLGSETYNVASHFSQVAVWGNNGSTSTQPIRSFLSVLTGLSGQGAMRLTDFRFLDIKTPDNAGVSGHTITNIYGLKIGTLKGAGGYTISNGYGVFQEGTQDLNFFAGNVLLGTTTDAGYKLDVNGTGRFQGALNGTSATFSDAVTISMSAGNYPRFISTVGAKSWEIGYRSGTTSYEIREDGTTRLAIANGGAATFSSSVTAAGAQGFILTNGSTWNINTDANTFNISETNIATRFTINKTTGAVGIGVTPSAWQSTNRAIQLGQRTFISNNADGSYSNFGNNAYFDGTNWVYLNNAPAGIMQVNGNNFYWQQAPSGTGNIAFTQAMTLDASGRLMLGTTGALGRFTLVGSASGAGTLAFDTDGSRTEIQSYNKPLEINRQGNNTILNSGGGNVGIGTTSPSYKLHVVGPNPGVAAFFSNASNADLYIDLTSGVSLISPTTGTLAFGTSSTERMRITSGGNVGIGLTNPSATLHVNGTIKTDAPSANTAGAWKLGGTLVAIGGSDGTAIPVEIDGTIYYVMLAYPA